MQEYKISKEITFSLIGVASGIITYFLDLAEGKKFSQFLLIARIWAAWLCALSVGVWFQDVWQPVYALCGMAWVVWDKIVLAFRKLDFFALIQNIITKLITKK